jgi:preprotein translocase subunit SecY
MWLGELITEKGIGNGISFIIFAGIVSQVPGAIGSFMDNPDLARVALLGIVAVAAVACIIYIQEGQRRIPSSTPAVSAAGACTRAARRSSRCGSTRPA